MTSDASDPIKFYAPDERPFGWLSTFSPHPITLGGHRWATVEHYFQAHKFRDPALQSLIRTAASPGEAKSLAAKHATAKRPDWYDIREGIMLEALRAKFTQHPELIPRLLETQRPIEERSPDDTFWGRLPNGEGANRLGVLLMRIRLELAGAMHE